MSSCLEGSIPWRSMRSQKAEKTTSFLVHHRPLVSCDNNGAKSLISRLRTPVSVFYFLWLTSHSFCSSRCSFWPWSGRRGGNFHFDQLGQTPGSHHWCATSTFSISGDHMICGDLQPLPAPCFAQGIASSTRPQSKVKARSWTSPTQPHRWLWATSFPGSCTTSASTPWRIRWRASLSLYRSTPLETHWQVEDRSLFPKGLGYFFKYRLALELMIKLSVTASDKLLVWKIDFDVTKRLLSAESTPVMRTLFPFTQGLTQSYTQSYESISMLPILWCV